ncbi:unnamed protein product, partial [Durusdinium trenchii]
GKGWPTDGWWRDGWRYEDWGKAKGRGRRKGEKGEKGKADGKGEKGEKGEKGDKEKREEREKGKAEDLKEKNETKESLAPRAKDEVFEEIRNVLNANPALQIGFFDARVRQQLHALLGSGGRPRLKAALTFIHTCTMHKTRQDVKNWPAYLLTLLKKFDSDNQEEPSDRRSKHEMPKQKTEKSEVKVFSSASTTPEKASAEDAHSSDSEADGFQRALELTGLKLELTQSDDEREAPGWDDPLDPLPAPRVTAPPPKPRPEEFQASRPLGLFQVHRHDARMEMDLREQAPYLLRDLRGGRDRDAPLQVYPDRPRLDRDHAGLHDGPPFGFGSTFGTFGTQPDGRRRVAHGVGGTSSFPAPQSPGLAEVVAR